MGTVKDGWRSDTIGHFNDRGPPTLLSQTIRIAADDKFIASNLYLFADLPGDIVTKLSANASAYGLCLLESKGFIGGAEKQMFWKHLASRITNKFYDRGNQRDTLKSDLQQMYFQRVFYDVVQHFDRNEDVFAKWFNGYIKNSKLYSTEHTGLFTERLRSLKAMFQEHLAVIRFYPRILQNLEKVTTCNGMLQNSTSKVSHVEFRDFMSFKQCHMLCIRNMLCGHFFPNLKGLTFLNCKFGALSMERFYEVLWDNHLHERSKNSDMQKERLLELLSPGDLLKRNHSGDSFIGSFTVPRKKQRFDDTLDAATCYHEANLDESSLCNDAMVEAKDKYVLNENGGIVNMASNIKILSFQNCHVTSEAMEILCEIVNKLPSMISFTLCPEWRLLIRESDEVIHSMVTNPVNSSCIDSIVLENCMPGHYSKNVLLWHGKAQCTDKNILPVPKPRVLKLIDCNLVTSQVDCQKSTDHEQNSHVNCSSGEFQWCFDLKFDCACNWSNLSTLDFSENKFERKEAEALAQALNSAPVIKSMTLKDCGMDTNGCGFIFKLAKENTSLEYLNMSGNRYDSNSDGSLRDLIIHGHLKNLILAFCIVPGGFSKEFIDSFSRNSTLESLDLSVNRLGGEEFCQLVEILTKPSTLSALKILDLRCNKIPASLLPDFAKSLELSNRKMKEVNLNENLPHNFLFKMQGSSLKFLDTIKRRVASFKIEGCEHYISQAGVVALSDFASVM